MIQRPTYLCWNSTFY